MFLLTPVKTHETTWDPIVAHITLNARLDARLVPHGSGMRLDYGHIVVLDNFIDEAERQALLDKLTQPDWDHSHGPPIDKWERETADGAGLPKTWGLKDSVLQQLATSDLPAMQEIHARLTKLYPDYTIAHMPSDMIQRSTDQSAAEAEETTSLHSEGAADIAANNRSGQTIAAQLQEATRSDSSESLHDHGSHSSRPTSSSSTEGDHKPADRQHPASVDCNQFVGNAAVYGDCYTWHVDADPSAFPASPWVDTFGHYCNGDPGQLIYTQTLSCLMCR